MNERAVHVPEGNGKAGNAMPVGTVMTYDARKGCGTIQDNDTGRDIVFDVQGIKDPLLKQIIHEEQHVNYGIIKTARGDRAIQINPC